MTGMKLAQEKQNNSLLRTMRTNYRKQVRMGYMAFGQVEVQDWVVGTLGLGSDQEFPSAMYHIMHIKERRSQGDLIISKPFMQKLFFRKIIKTPKNQKQYSSTCKCIPCAPVPL